MFKKNPVEKKVQKQSYHGLAKYHIIWLEANPGRTADWLRERLAEGFDMHHIDGNHDNNDIKNLVLIENRDHGYLHSGKADRKSPKGRIAKVKKGVKLPPLTKKQKREWAQKQYSKQGWLPEKKPSPPVLPKVNKKPKPAWLENYTGPDSVPEEHLEEYYWLLYGKP